MLRVDNSHNERRSSLLHFRENIRPFLDTIALLASYYGSLLGLEYLTAQ